MRIHCTQLLKICGPSRSYTTTRSPTALPMRVLPFHYGNPSDLQEFRKQAFDPGLPILLKPSNAPRHSLPEDFDIYHKLKKHEFHHAMCEYRTNGKTATELADEISILKSFSESQGFDLPSTINDPLLHFHTFYASLGVVLAGAPNSPKIRSLYIAQTPIDTLPPGLQELFPDPVDIIKCGKGDIYGSSIWIGNPPLYTPLHKDPNPNIFSQHRSSKTIRLMRPALGRALFDQIQHQLRRNSSASFRGEEMMQGAEFDALDKAVWHLDSNLELHETAVEPGQSLFIPKGWWHSVKSIGKDLNVSSNWWFR